VAGEKEESSAEMGGGTTEWGEEGVGLDLREKWSFFYLVREEIGERLCERRG
jgi:hypothetical protein